MSNQRYLRFFFAFLLLATGFFVYTIIQNIRRTNQTFELVNHTYRVIGDLQAVSSSVFDLESQVRGYVISGNPVFLRGYDSSSLGLQKQVTELASKTIDNADQQRHVAELRQLVQAKISFQGEVLAAYHVSRQESLELIAGLRGKALADSLKARLHLMERLEQNLLQQRIRDNRETTGKRYYFSIFIVCICFVLLLLALFRLLRENRLRRAAEQLAQENGARYSSLIENSSVVVYRAQLNGQIEFVNRNCARMTGYTPDELIGQRVSMLITDEWKPKVEAFYREQVRTGTFETLFEFPIRTKGGATRWVEQSMVLLQEPGRKPGFQSVVKDITEKREAEERLNTAELAFRTRQEESQFRLQAILDNIPMVVYIKDLDGRYILVNRRFRETFDLAEEEVLGRTNLEVFRNEDMAEVLAGVDEQVKTLQTPLEFEDVIRTNEGDRHMLVTKFPLFDRDNRIFAISGVDKDISDMVRNRQQLIDARLRAEKAEKLQEEFLANMSHEIRTPMNGIIGMANLLDESALNTDQKEFVQLIKQSSDTLLVLINDILDLSKIKAGRMTVETISFSVSEVVDAVLSPMRLRASGQEVVVDKWLDGRLPAYVSGDRHKLFQVLNNLVSNAVKFTAQGKVSVLVRVLHQEAGAVRLQFQVTDTGIGIAPEHLDYVFESFAQAGNDMIRRFGGTGLGLAITKRLIELQGGAIRVESQLGAGSTFTFELTYQPGTGIQEKAEKAADAWEGASLSGKRILLVEDNLINQKVTMLMLQKAGIGIEIAGNGREAVELLEGGARYDLIIMDLQMPEMNGFQATTYIRTKLKLEVPIIAMTASALRNERTRCMEVGMNEYLTKPFVPAELFAHLRRFLCGAAEVAAPADLDTTSGAGQQELYNLSYLRELEDDGYLVEMLSLFLQTTPELLDELRACLLFEQWEEVRARAHKLKGSLGFLQMHRMMEQVAEIETLAVERQDPVRLQGLAAEVAQEYELIRPMLEADLQQAERGMRSEL